MVGNFWFSFWFFGYYNRKIYISEVIWKEYWMVSLVVDVSFILVFSGEILCSDLGLFFYYKMRWFIFKIFFGCSFLIFCYFTGIREKDWFFLNKVLDFWFGLCVKVRDIDFRGLRLWCFRESIICLGVKVEVNVFYIFRFGLDLG